jgi:hypothetical protein
MTARLRSDVPKEKLGDSIRELLAVKTGKPVDGDAPMAKETE